MNDISRIALALENIVKAIDRQTMTLTRIESSLDSIKSSILKLR